ncbi:MAG: hypothetical protein ACKN9T_06440 [Candidatus Methylumidiphilus sp.]
MDTLIQDLQKTIAALETLSDKPATASEQVDELLDQLFQHKTDVVNAVLNPASPLYQQAAAAMKQAAAKAEQAAKDPKKLGEVAGAVGEAVGKLAKLLDGVIPIA